MSLELRQIIVRVTKAGFRKVDIYKSKAAATHSWATVAGYKPIWAVWLIFDPTTGHCITERYYHEEIVPEGKSSGLRPMFGEGKSIG